MTTQIVRDFTPSKNAGLASAKLATRYINRQELASGLISYEYKVYELQADLFLANYLEEHAIAKVVVSFQTYFNGERIAVARLHRELI